RRTAAVRSAARRTGRACAASFQMAAAIDANRFARDEIAVDAGKNRFRNFVLAAPASERRRLLDLFHFAVARAWRGENRPRGDGVDENVVGGELEGQRFGERDRA